MKSAFDNVWASVVRTFVPIVVSGVMTWLVSLGITPDDALEGTLTVLAGALLGGLYHLVVRLLEVHVNPHFGWLLGSAKQPVAYAKMAASGTPMITNLEETRTGELVSLTVESTKKPV